MPLGRDIRTWATALAVVLVLLVGGRAGAARLETAPADFVQPGSQPSEALDTFGKAADLCRTCHGGYLASDNEPWDAWAASMMAQAARDPVTRAAALLANDDAAGAGETCIRCHAPIGWLAGRSANGRFADLTEDDLDGIACNVCHRFVDPIARAGRPVEDDPVLAALDAAGVRPPGTCRQAPAVRCTADADCAADGPCEVMAGNGRFVVDPLDTRRGPFVILRAAHATIASPYHRGAEACAPCHDVSTPTLSRQEDGTYALNALGAPHPTQDPHDMFPEQRTYSEWRASAFARGGVVFPDGRFGGALTAQLPNTVPVSTCQDCHLPDARAPGCDEAGPRPDMPTHGFAGSNSWVLGAVLDAYPGVNGLDADAVARALGRTERLMAAAADVELSQEGRTLRVRVVNQAGHKLPTGYPEGRRMWLNVRFFASDGQAPMAEDGAYDPDTATLDVAHTTKTYQTDHVVDDAVGAAAGLAAGTPFHLALSNRVAFDNRIPPRGFTNAAFEAVRAAPVGVEYADGQHWDDTLYPVPERAVRVEVTLYHQTTTREYAEFLRDTVPDGGGLEVYERWLARGRTPLTMRRADLDLAPPPTTTTTTTTTATTTTAAPCLPTDGPCCGRADGAGCDDGDDCTRADVCAGGRCGGSVADADGVRCLLGRLTSPESCAILPAKLRKAVKKGSRRAQDLLRAAERVAVKDPARARARLAKIGAALAPIGTRAGAAVTAGKPAQQISASCAAAFDRLVSRIATATAGVSLP